MRISTNQLFNTGTQGILRNQSDLLSTQNHIAAEKRVLVPSDDPVAAARAIVVTQADAVNSQYIKNQGYATDKLSLLESKLTSAVDTTQNILEKIIEAGNGTLTDSGRKDIATELRQRLAELISIANSQDGSGSYIFSGFKTNVKPFVAVDDPTDASASTTGPYSSTNSYVSFNGDQGQTEIQVDPSRTMATSESGYDVFVKVTDSSGNSTNASVFDSLKNMIDLLETPIATNATFQTDYAKGLSDLQAFLDTAGRVRSSVGARMSELESLGTSSSALSVQYQETLSDLQDLDYVSAYTQLTKQSVQLQSAMKSFNTISNLSLFNYI